MHAVLDECDGGPDCPGHSERDWGSNPNNYEIERLRLALGYAHDWLGVPTVENVQRARTVALRTLNHADFDPASMH